MVRAYVNVDADEVLDELSDDELIEELNRRGRGANLDLEGARREDLVRALNRSDWAEVEYLLRTYFIRDERRFMGPIPDPRVAKYGRRVN